MSAFVCDAKTFNNIEYNLHRLLNGNKNGQRFYFPYSVEKIIPSLGYNFPGTIEEQEKDLSKMVKTLKKLNIVTVSLKYKHHYKNVLEAIKEGYFCTSIPTDKNRLSKIQLVKSLHCLRYQIETEHLEQVRELTQNEKNALLFLDILINQLQYYIVTNTKAYNEAEWG